MDAQAVQLMEPRIDQILEELDVSIMYRFLQSPIGYSRSVNTDTSNGCFRLQPMRKNSVRRLPQPRASAVDFPTRVCCFHRRPSASANSFSRRDVRGRTSAVDFSASEYSAERVTNVYTSCAHGRRAGGTSTETTSLQKGHTFGLYPYYYRCLVF